MLTAKAAVLRRNFSLDSIVKPHRAAFQGFRSDMSKGLTGSRLLVLAPGILKDRRNSSQAIDSGVNEEADLVDQTRFEKRAVDSRAAFEEEGFQTECLAENF